jgi:hypothetical protein
MAEDKLKMTVGDRTQLAAVDNFRIADQPTGTRYSSTETQLQCDQG